ncbi:5-deoxy-glucuronate isomerase [Cupriavidus sp. P-10]|uniref:5-deoxy-glucuronate isomerase n=1 Tax=Cupriavidus sp. P-10 TaxID=2027911 RepID=UPI000E2F8443|nr:5-deoxy-glucuronate isomerase [Cupriavidus sp. P-10]BDB24511.1 5-deoxy-glucuronate isomerase [Cupriavidus sp. P-10]
MNRADPSVTPRAVAATRPSLLVKGAQAERVIVDVTPQSAGWTYIGFKALRLADGETESLATAARELCVTVLSGEVDVHVGDQRYSALGSRQSVFEDQSPYAVYVPPGREVRIDARGGAEVALSTAPAQGRLPARVIEPGQMRRSVRGEGANTRYVCDILPESEPAESLLVVEVITPSGHSSSYPPHKHDSTGAAETALEETYYHQLNPPRGFAFQRVYTDDRSLDEAMAVEHRDTVLVPRGYHPCCAPYGYDLYYLNTMAGPERRWAFRNDPAHEWMLTR